jgi:VIT1/CCC1 family predicted Fe2+/Mn2+ transporter
MNDKENIKRYLANLIDENNSAALYTALANKEEDPRLAEVYRRLAATELKHANEWARRIIELGGEVPSFRPSLRTRILIWLAEKFGIDSVLPTIAGLEHNNSNAYAGQPEAKDMVADEHSHAMVLKQMAQSDAGSGLIGSSVAKLEGRHRTAGGNALRAAVLGASDGLLSNFNLVMGVAGAELSNGNILLTGFAGLLAGAISMALGEWISVQSSRELYQRQLDMEKDEIAMAPEEELEELVLIYQARGLDEETARTLATKIMSNPSTAIEALAHDELGIDPEELGGSAWEAALTSFLLFALGAIIPVIPFLFTAGHNAILISALCSAVGLFGVGAVITLFTGKPVLYSGLRQVLFGLIAAAVTFGIGHVIGVSISG